ncbi:hypothetical protein [Undibacterium fentianense]|uniref:Transmembrane protein n=1 Tax=Undibacterium fentianense TaxID=2828728 RepID=A0A941E0W9_9BURK|nr:hypothetical protein [Undibacterium fentianense]MBR7798911.1 hypothetical protein [Undibacterium fentianense]
MSKFILEIRAIRWIFLFLLLVIGILCFYYSNDDFMESRTGGCLEIVVGESKMWVPKKFLSRSTPKLSNSANFIFLFDKQTLDRDCRVNCNELFVNVSFGVLQDPKTRWDSMAPKFSGETFDGFKVFYTNSDPGGQRNILLVPPNVVNLFDDFYSCSTYKHESYASCDINTNLQNGLSASFYLPKKSLVKVSSARKLISDSLNQFLENKVRGTCE